ncbi:hypothetical protein [Parasphingorhabdus sp.]|uniref:hypothetical protein n=1 Tax=Parasphingorhabdus sp. TaxID=2709688 RepID=UPI0030A3D06F|nr:hypothetical protein [Sphingomonadales bacterium]
MMKIFLISAAALSGAGLLALPVQAQDQPGDRVNQLVIYGDDLCPQSSAEEIVVCARKGEGDRYRIPETLRGGGLGDAKNQAWSERVRSYEYVGASGTSSCSPAGAGGFTGCTQALLSQAYAEKGIDDTVNWGQLIEEERQNRLSRIDAESDAVEERVLEIEADRELREAAAEAARDRLDVRDADAVKTTNDLAVPPGADETPGPDGE